MNNKNLIFRISSLVLIIIAFIVLCSNSLHQLQIVSGAEYKAAADKSLAGSTTVYAARGEIVDRNGVKLVSNSTTFTVRFNKSAWDSSKQNDVIAKLIALAKNYNISHNTSLPISLVDGEYIFSAKTDNLIKFIESKKAPENTNSPDLIIAFLVDRYNISTEFTNEQILEVISVRYQMEQDAFSAYNGYNFAEDVGIEFVTYLKEMAIYFPGVEIDTIPVREYQTPYAAHILGRVTPIYAEEYSELREQGYKLNATIGRDGMEKTLEPYLKATDGKQASDLIIDGEVIATGESIAPIPGYNAVLTIDINLQRVAEESLARTLQSITDAGRYTTEGGAAVVIDIATGEILALASYPTYSLETFNSDFNTLNNDPLKPMINRAISGLYAPGSTYKMVTALASLEEGVSTVNTVIRDQGIYRFYAPDYTPACWIYNDYGGTHGNLTVSGAIKHSCNYYFYEVGRILTGSTMETYANYLGLGMRSGIELSGESRGTVAGPTSRTARGSTWYPGDTLSAAIGQSDHLYTPLQLANYIATLANGGTLNTAHLLKEVQSSDYTEIIFENTPAPIHENEFDAINLDAILQGMSDVVNEGGTAASIFRNYPIQVAGKTGSAQVDGGSANGVFVSFAPYDNPEIAICVLGERAGSGGNVAPVVRDIYDEYFGFNDILETP